MKKDWIIEKLIYDKKHNAVKYMAIKLFSDADIALKYLNKHKNESIQLSNKFSINTEIPIMIVTDKGRKELTKIKD